MESARLLEEKCREFSVEGSVVQIHPGPVVTTFEFKPDAGVKYAKITGLADDLCLAMKADSVLIDRIPGKSTVGIQIPNHTREPISLRELLESEAYRRSTSKLTIALGKTIHGEPYMADLATMPHLLIAGSTGAGKSVSMNGMLTSILYRASPDDVRMIMIDPKRLELGMYEEIPHLMTPVVVDPKQAANALRWAVREMEERYKTLAAVGVRNIEQYNRNIRAALAEGQTPEDGKEMKTLPFIVVVIDELADLMMVASNEVEESIARLAQMARAVGIHLILATQRPSVDVITGLIKANLPARIAFRVASKIDSRTILDGNGAEQLLGKGDMLFLPPASSRFIRVHAPYISEQESARLASFLRKQGKPVYDETITAEEKIGARRHRDGEGRPLRRSGAHRRQQRTGVDLVSAAEAAHRLQPRGAAGRHDGDGRHRVAAAMAASRAKCSSTRATSKRSTRSSGEHGCTMVKRTHVCFTAEIAKNAEKIVFLGVLCVLCGFFRSWLRRPPPVRTMYNDALAREQTVRAALNAADATPAVLADVRAVVAGYEAVVRHYPASGYSDNALWQAGRLSLDAFARFGQAADKDAGIRMLEEARGDVSRRASWPGKSRKQLTRAEQRRTSGCPKRSVTSAHDRRSLRAPSGATAPGSRGGRPSGVA